MNSEQHPTPCKYCGTQKGNYVKANGGGTICMRCIANLREMENEDNRQLQNMTVRCAECFRILKLHGKAIKINSLGIPFCTPCYNRIGYIYDQEAEDV